MTEKRKTSFQLTAEALRLLVLLAGQSGISQSAVLELLIRADAKRKGIS